MLLKDLITQIVSFAMFSSNLADKNKQVVVVINGERFTLSPKLSADFRSKKVSIEELGDYTVRDVEGADGTTFKSLGYAGEDIQVKITEWKSSGKTTAKVLSVEEFNAQPITYEEAIA